MTALPRISHERLSSLLQNLKSPSPNSALTSASPSLAIIDVRDDDHIGGHIHTSTHIPSATLDYKIPELVRTLADKEIVVFHCALSQQRGPSAAARYLRERERVMRLREAIVKKRGQGGGEADGGKGKRGVDVENVGSEGVIKEEREDFWEGNDCGKEKAEGKVKGQEVYVLDGGFVKWQEKYGRDPKLTDAFAPDIWVDYY